MAILKHRYHLGVGSNVEPHRHIASCVRHFTCSFSQVRLSPVYQSPAFGFDGSDFLNMVIEVQTAFDPFQFKHWLKHLEDIHGRDRSQPRYSNRNLDIDLLLCDDLIIQRGGIELPRPEILRRHYVLKPLQDLSPDLIHPTAQKRLSDLWKALSASETQPLNVVRFDWGSITS